MSGHEGGVWQHLRWGSSPAPSRSVCFPARASSFHPGEKVLLTVRDGNQQQVFRDYINKPNFIACCARI